jgi:hypothetical protein
MFHIELYGNKYICLFIHRHRHRHLRDKPSDFRYPTCSINDKEATPD